jgi:hypothetical protein
MKTYRDNDTEWTHEFHEQGNGFPSDGEDVIIADDLGWHKIVRVAKTSAIHTRQWQANYLYTTIEDSDTDYESMSESEQAEAWENLHHVCPITEEATE